MIKIKKLFEFLKNEIVVVLSFLLALVSACFVAPSEKYIEYIDFRTISLLICVNIGGLGTLIASMASLISFRFIQQEKINTRKYLLVFTVMNIVFLASNLILYSIVK